ncbi:MAG: hypothetical protein QG577_1310, partial [Thermodesulfobacteriota bacterium]|nr:hypothetical protein [Thermodesulfobacteriota bacterium]
MNSSGADYHVSTSYDRFGMSGHSLDWSNQPAVFKAYPGQDPIVRPDDLTFSQRTLWDTLSCSRSTTSNGQRECDFTSLSRVLALTHTVTAKARYGGTEFFYRSVASAGALYPFEL